MKANILILIPVICLSSCNSNRLSSRFFDDFLWTRWVSEDGSSILYTEGTRDGSCAVGFFDNKADLYEIHMSSFKGSLYIVMWASGYGELGDLYKSYINGKVDNNSFVCSLYNEERERSITYHAETISVEEINLSHFICGSFVTNGDIVYYQDNGLNNFDFPRKWVATVEDQQIELRFGENRTFEFKKGELTSIGTYICDYEKATLSFSTNQIFEENELILTYAA